MVNRNLSFRGRKLGLPLQIEQNTVLARESAGPLLRHGLRTDIGGREQTEVKNALDRSNESTLRGYKVRLILKPLTNMT